MIQILCGCFLCGLLPSLLKSGYYPLCYGILDNFLSITKNSYSSRPLTRHHSYIFLIRVCDDHSATWHFYYLFQPVNKLQFWCRANIPYQIWCSFSTNIFLAKITLVFFKNCHIVIRFISSFEMDWIQYIIMKIVKVGEDIELGSCVFQCDVPHQWIAQRQVGPVSVYCNGMGCHVLCLWHGISVWQGIGQSTTTTSRHRRNTTSDV